MWRRGAVCLALAGACSKLPSEAPLGKGPLAVAEDKRIAQLEAGAPATADSGKDASGAGATAKGAQSPAPAKPAKPAEPDAAASASAAKRDAGSDAAPPPTGKALAWAGTYSGSDVSIYRMGALPERRENDPNAKTRVVDNSDGSVSLTAINSSNGQDICTLKATPKGASRTDFEVTPGQSCFGGGAVKGTIKSGSAVFSGNSLKLSLDAEIEVTSGPMQMTGSLEYQFTGTR